jgi:hypothetical protein
MMRFQLYYGGKPVLIEAPDGSRFRRCDPEEDCLVVPQDGAGFPERYLPESVVVLAARLGMYGLSIRDGEPPSSSSVHARETIDPSKSRCIPTAPLTAGRRSPPAGGGRGRPRR